MSTPVRSDLREGGVLLLTLDRPPANAIDEAMLEALESACSAAARDPGVRAVVLTGAGAFFCGGFDLGLQRRDAAGTRRLGDLYREAHLRLLELPKPTVALVRGHATAGGLVLVLACDYRLGAVGDWRLGLNEVSNGMPVPILAHELARDRLDPRELTASVLQAKIYGPEEAVRAGWLDRAVLPEELEAHAIAEARRLAKLPAKAYAMTKRSLRRVMITEVRATMQLNLEQITGGAG